MTTTKRKKEKSPAPTHTAKLRPRLHRGGPLRLKPRVADAGQAPEGPLDAEAVSRAVAARIHNVLQDRDENAYEAEPLLKDLAVVLTGAEDLPLFAQIGAPVTARTFIWARLLGEALEELLDDECLDADEQKTLGIELGLACEAVRLRKNRVSVVAQSCAVNATLLTTEPATPARLLASGQQVVRLLRRRLPRFHDPKAATALVDDLAAALATLGTLVGEQTALRQEKKQRAKRSVALRALLFEVLSFITPRGRAAVGGDRARRDRYRLVNLFPRRSEPALE